MIVGIFITAFVVIAGLLVAFYFAMKFAENSVVADMRGNRIWHCLFFVAIILTFFSYLLLVGICIVYFFLY